MPVDHVRRLGHETDESVLDNVLRPVGVPVEQAGGVAEQRRLVARDCRLHKGAGIETDMGFFRFDIHETSLLTRLNAGFIRPWTQLFGAEPFLSGKPRPGDPPLPLTHGLRKCSPTAPSGIRPYRPATRAAPSFPAGPVRRTRRCLARS